MNTLEELREQIDQVDRQLLQDLAKRLELVKTVGAYKQQHSLPALQPERWQAVLADRCQKGENLGLSKELIMEVWERLHQEALSVEAKIIEEKN